MEQLVIVRAAGQGRFTARALGVPEIRAEGGAEAAALDQVRQSLAAWFTSAKLVRIDVAVNGTGNPWLDTVAQNVGGRLAQPVPAPNVGE